MKSRREHMGTDQTGAERAMQIHLQKKQINLNIQDRRGRGSNCMKNKGNSGWDIHLVATIYLYVCLLNKHG